MEWLYLFGLGVVLILIANALATVFSNKEHSSWDNMYHEIIMLAQIMEMHDRVKMVTHVHGIMEESGATDEEDGELMINMQYYFLALDVLREINPAKYGSAKLKRQIRWIKKTDTPEIEFKLMQAVREELENISNHKIGSDEMDGDHIVVFTLS